MSVVVAVAKEGRIAIAGDSLTNFGEIIVPTVNHRAEKIVRIGTAYLATTGWAIYENILRDFVNPRRPPSLADERAIYRFFLKLWKALHEKYGLVNDQSEEQHSPFGDLGATFLVVNRKGIFNVAADMSVTCFSQYYAIGSGYALALGALHALYGERYGAEELARKAVEAAVAFSPYCGGEIQLHRVK